VNANTEIKLEDLHATIEAAIKAKFPDLKTVEFYREDRDSLDLPACLLDLTEFEEEPKEDPGTGQLAVMARFEAEFVLGFRTPKAKLSARILAAAFAHFVSSRRWPGGKVGKAESIQAYKSDFKPELDQYEVWCVEWRQIVHLGESVWKDEGTVPTTVFLGHAPKIGIPHVDHYVQVHPK
jgi:hypothetical protein